MFYENSVIAAGCTLKLRVVNPSYLTKTRWVVKLLQN